ncbi:iron complex transport system ATP-binding protein [Bacillus mesophilus]|uniref:ABC transporter ATP-binding protein n=1 Tax=Bacillus mesophilus TaxID=1808955 RepID=A0A6M0QAJ5_9BACI|nr:ABC transporter ATP-binding protein [Bacillus mesophilus]MBM7661858.1 iron complex transport system ATP-binding protein [Bacillus mesophilus]NEY72779.1 ABC transporter ATP-binding protein [Bacillus mesophilus]
MENVLNAEQLSYGYVNTQFISELSISFHKGEMVSIIGPNGSGKSTVLRLMTRLLKPKNGVVYLEGEKINGLPSKDIAQKMTMLPQINDHRLDLTVRDLVKYGRHPYLKWYEEYNTNHNQYIDWAIAATNLTALQHRSLQTLSGGERQRAWIAMSIAQTPNILLLDEPTSYLDIAHQLEVMELLKELNRSLGITIIMVLHDVNQAAKYSHRIIAMKDGNVVRQGEPREVYNCEFFRDVFSIEAKVHMEGSHPICDPYGLVSYQQKTIDWSVVK